MSNIVLITAGSSIAHYAEMLRKTLPTPENLSIVNCYMEEAVDYARNQLPSDTDVLIARGNTAKLLKAAHLSIPIVTIPIRDSELIQSIKSAKEAYNAKGTSIAYLGIEDVLQSVREFLNLMHCKIRLYPINSSQDIRTGIQRAKKEGVKVVIGGIYTQQLAAEAGLDCILLESSLASVKEAYERALEVQRSFILQRKKVQERTLILNSITDGILSINETGRVTVCNPAAETYFDSSSAYLCGKSFAPLFPQSEKELIQKCLTLGQSVTHHSFFLNDQTFQLSINPIFAGSSCRGAVLTFSPESSHFRPDSAKQQLHQHSLTSMQSNAKGNEKGDFYSFFELTGMHPLFQHAISLGIRYAKLSMPVLLIGEEGTGKETFARCMHHLDPQNPQIFVSREASLLTTDDLLSANTGTLYLRNAHKLSLSMQETLSDLLRTGSVRLDLQTRKALRLRLILSSDQDLSKLLTPGFYYLVNSLILPLPSLAQRREDIPLLIHRMLEHFNLLYEKNCTCTPAFSEKLALETWSGNIRQLESLIQRMIVLADPDAVFTGTESLSASNDSAFYEHLRNNSSLTTAEFNLSVPTAQPGILIKGRNVSFEELKELDRFYHGKKALIAQKLGISRSTLWRFYKMMGNGNI